MAEEKVSNVNIISQSLLPTPENVQSELPLDAETEQHIVDGRHEVQNILDKKDPRLFVVMGPCSIHDTEAAMDYANRLKALADQVKDTLMIIMRVYFEKPRTSIGWKGLINDPRLDDSFHIEEGLFKARKLLLDINKLGLTAATEGLDPLSPQYIGDLITWTAIGARTTESQTHREMSSGLSTPVGFKNGTDGGLTVAINAMQSASHPHNFLGINRQGQCAVIRTKGNQYGHVVLRGGKQPNFDSVHVAEAEEELNKANLPANIVIDCSHGNSNKKHDRQPLVAENVVNQVLEGNKSIVGLMLESNINEGNQSIPENLADLKYGVSVTDACINWETSEQLILKLHNKLKPMIADRFK
ncbi:MAG: 3-deoxy-7-phosphoheptulonate synthase [Kangiellaceae bacterium]|nr:3-deoxy-7-phosphoheptulonate synthase [Kangiellaceae bacterium]|tara:strand:+ start:1504 stop:2574 length:1071 start_codon:yes stop_codon:yes gene_type:complete